MLVADRRGPAAELVSIARQRRRVGGQHLTAILETNEGPELGSRTYIVMAYVVMAYIVMALSRGPAPI